MITAKLDHVVKEANNIYSFYFHPEKKIDFTAGQFVEVHLSNSNPDSRGTKRWFTISSAPELNDFFSITTRMADSRGSSFKESLRSMKKGQEIKISDAMGDFVLPKNENIPLVFIAGGIGITPFHSIISHLIATKQKRDIRLYYGTRSSDELVFNKELGAYLGNNLFPVLQNAPTNYKGKTGFLDISEIFKDIKNMDCLIYISGPEPMVEKFKKEFEDMGVNKNSLVCDYFPGYI
jgi:ferredoxin-NADP reductase